MPMNKNNKKLTSAYVDEEIFNEFKILSFKHKFNIQKLVENAMDLYLKDEEVRSKLRNNKLGN
jgi:hypothetical protein